MTACIDSHTLKAYSESKLLEPDARHVEEHLEQCDRCCMELSRVAQGYEPSAHPSTGNGWDVASLDSSSSRSPAYQWWRNVTAPELGQPALHRTPVRIGRYRVLKQLGSGGFGRVLQAVDEQLDRHVAIKVPHGPATGPGSHLPLILAEAKTVANLDHPSIVPIYDVASCQQFPLYLVTKLIDGVDLARHMVDGVSQADAVRWIIQISDALSYAHAKGIIHRDIKPHNILIEQGGHACLTDFGLAWRLSEGSAQHSRAGTPAYMSPEQLDGTLPLDHRADIYSLGRVLIELLGQDVALGSSRDPSRRSGGHELPVTVPAPLAAICRRATAPNREDRYSSAHELMQALHDFATEKGWSNLPRSYSTDVASHADLFTRLGWDWRTWATLVVLGVMVAGGMSFWSAGARRRAEIDQVAAYLAAPPGELSLRLADFEEFSPPAEQLLDAASRSTAAGERMRAHAALLKLRPDIARQVVDDMLEASPEMAEVLAKELLPFRGSLEHDLWFVLFDQQRSTASRLNASLFLAHAFPRDHRWSDLAGALVVRLMANDQMTVYSQYHKPVATHLIKNVKGLLAGPEIELDPGVLNLFHMWYALAHDDADANVELLMECPVDMTEQVLKRIDDKQRLMAVLRQKFHQLPTDPIDPMSGRLHRQRFLAAHALLKLGSPDEFWSIWLHTPDPDLATVSAYLVSESPSTLGLLAQRLIDLNLLEPITSSSQKLEERLFDPAYSHRRQLVRALFRSPNWQSLGEQQRQVIVKQTERLLLEDSDAGMQAIASWVAKAVNPISTWLDEPWFPKEQVSAEPGNRNWSLNSLEQVMVHIDNAPELAHNFCLAQRELETRFFWQFVEETGHPFPLPPIASQERSNPFVVQRPQAHVTWYDCAAFCNWLSRREGLQECFQPNAQGQYAEGMTIKSNALSLNGYRLPTSLEWEVGCRAGARTRFASGDLERYQAAFGWTALIAREVSPTGHVLPNALGLYDMHGNVAEWTLDDPNAQRFDFSLSDQTFRATRGGHYQSPPSETVASGWRPQQVCERKPTVGFRLARTR